jgi:hypothetical protein
MADLRTAIDGYYQAGNKRVVNFLYKLAIAEWMASFSNSLKLCEILTYILVCFLYRYEVPNTSWLGVI